MLVKFKSLSEIWKGFSFKPANIEFVVFIRSLLALCGILLLFSCTVENESLEDTLFHIVPSESSGIDFSNKINSTSELNILNYLYFYNGSGVAAADFNNDGLLDLYFGANQEQDKLYLNKGGLKFEEVSIKAGISARGWSTGITIVDINYDGLMDIYICEVGNYQTLKGHNRLYVNQGVGPDGIPIFKEKASQYGLDFSGLSTQAAFFDYDLDGDLDLFLMNHSVHPNSNYGIGARRAETDSLSGDRLYRNDNGKYIDVSAESGIYSGKIGYGLGLAVGDLNNDTFPDIYVGNDFFENDYVYINQGDGSFKDIVSLKDSGIRHTSHYSMGVDIGDFNNDGLQDIVSLDMLPEDLTTYKASGTDYSYQIYHNYLNQGYAHQYMQNALQLNQGNNNFSEIAHYAGIAATEWSWAPLFADFDNDGFKDLFISNGILGATNDMDYISFIANEKIQKKISQGISNKDLEMIQEIPVKKTYNYFFRNNGGHQFQKMNGKWASRTRSFSNGAVYADLDNDGDLDVVTNNVNEQAFLYENRSEKRNPSSFIKIDFEGPEKNIFGIGAKVVLYTGNGIQVRENFPTRGYLSAVPPVLHFGLGKQESIDSIQIIWPGGRSQILKDIKVTQSLNFNYNKSEKRIGDGKNDQPAADILPALQVSHREYSFKDFLYEPLIPYSQSNLGPGLSVLDLNGDGLQDIYFAGDQFSTGTLWIQDKEGKFHESAEGHLKSDSREPVDQVFFDADNDGDLDLLLVYGGSDPNTRKKNFPELYINSNGKMKVGKGLFDTSINASVVEAADFNQDGYMDLIVGSNSDFGSYGGSASPQVFLNKGNLTFNNKNTFTESLKKLEMVYDLAIKDMNNDGLKDLVVAAHYAPVSIFLNDWEGKFNKTEIPNTEGWWNALAVEDFDQDGDLDIVAGNWGLNTRLRASVNEPLYLYLNDFDDNGKIDPILTYHYHGRETPLATKDELSKQIPQLNKSYLSYTDFAKADFNDYFSKEKIGKAKRKRVLTLETTYFENQGGLKFITVPLPEEVQFTSINAMKAVDLDNDGNKDLVMGGNHHHVNTQLGRQDAGFGKVLKNRKGAFELSSKNLNLKGAIKAIETIRINDENYLIFGINNKGVELVKYPAIND